MNNYIIYI